MNDDDLELLNAVETLADWNRRLEEELSRDTSPSFRAVMVEVSGDVQALTDEVRSKLPDHLDLKDLRDRLHGLIVKVRSIRGAMTASGEWVM